MPEKDLNTYPVAELDEPEQQDDVSGNTPSEDESMEKITAWWDRPCPSACRSTSDKSAHTRR